MSQQVRPEGEKRTPVIVRRFNKKPWDNLVVFFITEPADYHGGTCNTANVYDSGYVNFEHGYYTGMAQHNTRPATPKEAKHAIKLLEAHMARNPDMDFSDYVNGFRLYWREVPWMRNERHDNARRLQGQV